jgi:hypothetical protein
LCAGFSRCHSIQFNLRHPPWSLVIIGVLTRITSLVAPQLVVITPAPSIPSPDQTDDSPAPLDVGALPSHMQNSSWISPFPGRLESAQWPLLAWALATRFDLFWLS